MTNSRLPILAKLLIGSLIGTLIAYLFDTYLNRTELLGSSVPVIFFTVVRILIVALIVFEVSVGKKGAARLILIMTSLTCVFTFLDLFAAADILKALVSLNVLETILWVASLLLATSKTLKSWLTQ